MKKKEMVLPIKFQILSKEEMAKTDGGDRGLRRNARDFWREILKRR